MKKPLTPRDTAWLSQTELAHALDLGIDYVRRSVVPALPREFRRRRRGRVEVHGRQAIEWLLMPRLLTAARKAIEAEHAAALAAKKLAELREIELLLGLAPED